jgi:hypothetical protein
MNLKEFEQAQLQLVRNFVADYERDRKKNGQTLFRPAEQWSELFAEYRENYDECIQQ